MNDFSDLTVTLADGVTELNLWNQTTVNGVSIKLWCNFPVANASYYLYWNNSNATVHWTLTVFDDIIDNINGAYVASLTGTAVPTGEAGAAAYFVLDVANNADTSDNLLYVSDITISQGA